MTRRAWERKEGEPRGAYNRFLIYLSLGPDRSLRAASEAYREGSRERLRGSKGHWGRLSSRWHWVERALAYDEAVLMPMARRTVVRVVRATDVIALKGLRELQRTDPKGWKQAMESITVAGAFCMEAAASCVKQDPEVENGEVEAPAIVE